jgi:hypothetical protein
MILNEAGIMIEKTYSQISEYIKKNPINLNVDKLNNDNSLIKEEIAGLKIIEFGLHKSQNFVRVHSFRCVLTDQFSTTKVVYLVKFNSVNTFNAPRC